MIREKLKDKRALAFLMVMSLVSFMGFVVENVWLVFTKGYINNRNMMFPFIMGYGVGLAVIYLFFGTPKRVLWFGKEVKIDNKIVRIAFYFFIVMICVSLGEIIIGTSFEKVFDFRWWNYEKLPLHITRYTSIPTSVMFSALICFFMNFLLNPLLDYFASWNYKLLYVVANLLLILMVIDFLSWIYYLYRNRSIRVLWKIPLRTI